MTLRFILASTLLFIAQLVNEKMYAQDSIRSDVFVLSTCSPTNFSLMKELSKNTGKKEYVKKLQVWSNNPSAMKITGINPLRYKYYINNEAVTQFMETSPITLAINTFLNGDYLLSAPEIKVPEIFKTDSISSKQKNKIVEFRFRNKIFKDSIESIVLKINDRWNYIKINNNNKKQKKKFIDFNTDSIYLKLYYDYDKINSLRNSNLKEYQIFISGLPINNPTFGILDQYFTQSLSHNLLKSDDSLEMEIDTIRKFQTAFAESFRNNHQKFKVITSILNDIDEINVGGTGLGANNKSFTYINANKKAEEDTLKKLMLFFNFYYTKTYKLKNDSTTYNSDSVKYNVDDIVEQMLDKRFQLYQEFILNFVTRLGILVQNQFIEFSSFNNELENYTCIDHDKLYKIEQKRKKLLATFKFIQKSSAELQVMASYLEIDTELYQNIAKKINTNYIFLLSYLKNLDYVTNDAVIQFTLPTHTNLKNIDLIRYTIKREDKITKGTQAYNYDFWVRGGLKIDFSVGFFGTQLTDNVYNKVLLDTAGGIDKIRITRQDDGHVNFAFGGMVNIIPRNGARWANGGVSIGIAYSGTQKLQVLSGLALHLGKTERIIIHGGVAFGTVKYLDVSASDFKFYDKDLKAIEREKLHEIKDKNRVYMLESPEIKFSSYTIPTVDKFSVRPFIGISYNLSKKNALQAVSGAGVSTFSENYKNGISY